MKFTLGEFNIVCTNLKQSIAFYRNIMKFELIEETETYAHLKCQEQTITLLAFAQKNKTKEKYGAQASFSLDLRVENLKEAYDYFKQKEINIAQEYKKEEGFFCIYDPDYLIWEIVQA